MPTYEYICEECNEEKTVFQGMSDPNPECHDKPMKRLISGAPHIRKGGGLYSVDLDGSSTKPLGDWKE